MRKQKKNGWFVGRGYRHFDHPLNFQTAQKIVESADLVTKHSFRPLISYLKAERRFKGFHADGSANVRHKTRLICYAAHKDAQIYAYYSFKLEQRYAELRCELGIDECVLAYRSGKGCNIHMANAAFEEIKTRESCSVLALDISGFFDNIDHQILKRNWCRVLGTLKLDADHYNLFVALTRFSRVPLDKCLNALGLTEKELKRSTIPLCDDANFHKKICGRGEGFKNIVMTNSKGRKDTGALNWNSHGIPQGTPISAVLSNIFMLDFDVAMKKFADSIGAVYRRYSDDILFICPQNHEAQAEQEIMALVAAQGNNLRVNPNKTEVARFEKNEKGFSCIVRRKDGSWQAGAVQYLGLDFNGKQKKLRHSTIARYQRKVKYAVRNARRTAQHFKRDKISTKALYLDLTDMGAQSMPSYAKRVAGLTGDSTAKKQLNTHKLRLKALIAKENAKLVE